MQEGIWDILVISLLIWEMPQPDVYVLAVCWNGSMIQAIIRNVWTCVQGLYGYGFGCGYSYTITISPHTNDPGQQVVKLVSQSALSKLASQELWNFHTYMYAKVKTCGLCVRALSWEKTSCRRLDLFVQNDFANEILFWPPNVSILSWAEPMQTLLYFSQSLLLSSVLFSSVLSSHTARNLVKWDCYSGWATCCVRCA